MKTIRMTPLQRSYVNGRETAETKELYIYETPDIYDESLLNVIAEKLFAAHPILTYGNSDAASFELRCGAGSFRTAVTDADDINEFVENIFPRKLSAVLELYSVRCGEKNYIVTKTDGRYFDGTSQYILYNELGKLIRGEEVVNESAFLEYADSISDSDEGELSDEAKEYWRNIADLDAPILPLCEKDTEPPITSVVRKNISEEEFETLNKAAAKCGTTVFALMLAVFSKSLSLYSSNKEFMLTLPKDERLSAGSGLAGNSIGLFADAMLFRFINEGKSILDTAVDVQYGLMETLDMSELPVGDIYRYIMKTGRSDFSVPVSFTDLSGIHFCDSTLKYIGNRVQTAMLNIEAIFQHTSKGYSFDLTYRRDAVNCKTAEGIAEVFAETISSLSENMDDVLQRKTLKPPKADMKLISELNHTGDAVCESPLSELITQAFRKYSDRTALISDKRKLTYSELERKAYSFGSGLRRKFGNESGLRIGILLPKSDRQIIAAAGCILCGIAYMPFETELNKESIAAVAKKAELSAIVTDEAMAEKISDIDVTLILYTEDEQEYHAGSYPVISGEDPAILINTSGTTGIPKTVLVKNSGIVNCLVYTKELFGLTENDRVLALTNFCHDMAVFDTFGLMICGGAAVVPDVSLQKDPSHWADLIRKYHVTAWNSVPVFLEMLAAYYEKHDITINEDLRIIDLGGDWIRPSFAEKALDMFPNARIFSVGGPTETTIWSIYHLIERCDCKSESIPYGRPFPAVKYHILNSRNELCPIGVAGTMFVSGVSVAGGYAGNAEETNKRFIDIDGCIYYDTGDNGMYLPDGSVRILGRSDCQVKIHGKRIELNGIENAAECCGNINGAVCVLSKCTGKLALFISSEDDIDILAFRNALSEKFPDYMLPADIIVNETLPITRNGKIDRKKLANTEISSERNEEKIGQIDETTEKLLAICRDQLENYEYDESLNFYMMGGDSLSSIGVIDSIKEMFGVELTITEMMMFPTLFEWAELIHQREKSMDAGNNVIADICTEIFGKNADDSLCIYDTDDPLSYAKRAAEILDSVSGEEVTAYHIIAYPFAGDWYRFLSGGK